VASEWLAQRALAPDVLDLMIRRAIAAWLAVCHVDTIVSAKGASSLGVDLHSPLHEPLGSPRSSHRRSTRVTGQLDPDHKSTSAVDRKKRAGV
jgi:hypothetical protein